MGIIAAIDQGTTGSTVLLLDENLQVLGKENVEFEQIFPKPGWVEHNPNAIWESVKQAFQNVFEKSPWQPKDLTCIGITNQRETTVVWQRATLDPIYNAIVWQDRRTTQRCKELQPHESLIRKKTGLVLDPYFSGTKVDWILKETQSLSQAKQGQLAFGTIDSYLVAKLTGGQAHITDATNASRTMLMDLESGLWDQDLCELLGVPKEMLPEIRSCSEVYGVTQGEGPIPPGIPIAGIAGDQQSALFGQACFEAGQAKCTYGTGAFILMNTGETPVHSQNGLLTTVAMKLGDKTNYALEGSAFMAGATVQWLRDGLGMIKSAQEIESLATQCDDSGGVVLVPAFTGLGAPHWRPEARGSIFGMTRGTTKAHLARAALEGIALQNVDILKAMEADSGQPLTALKVDGGAAANELLMQYQADFLNISISRPQVIETTALGAAFLAGLATGVWNSLREIKDSWKEEKRFSPAMDEETRSHHLSQWSAAVQKA